jgi:hypothetical protein
MPNSQISSQFSVTAVGTQRIAALAAALAAVSLDVDLLRVFGLWPFSDATVTSGQTATRTVVVVMGVGNFGATVTMPGGGGGFVQSVALSAFTPSPWAAPPVLQFVGGSPVLAAKATVQMGLDTSLVEIIKPGSGYTGATVASLVGGQLAPGGVPAVLGAPTILGGGITGVPVTSPGSGYTTYPQIIFTDSGGGSGAVAFALLNPVGITLTSGGRGYVTPPTIQATAVFKAGYPDVSNQAGTVRGWMQTVLADALRSPIASSVPVVS